MVKVQKYYINNLKKCITDLGNYNKKILIDLNTDKVNIATKDVIIAALKSEKAKIVTEHKALNKKYQEFALLCNDLKYNHTKLVQDASEEREYTKTNKELI